jgi:hypothetical protein
LVIGLVSERLRPFVMYQNKDVRIDQDFLRCINSLVLIQELCEAFLSKYAIGESHVKLDNFWENPKKDFSKHIVDLSYEELPF